MMQQHVSLLGPHSFIFTQNKICNAKSVAWQTTQPLRHLELTAWPPGSPLLFETWNDNHHRYYYNTTTTTTLDHLDMTTQLRRHISKWPPCYCRHLENQNLSSLNRFFSALEINPVTHRETFIDHRVLRKFTTQFGTSLQMTKCATTNNHLLNFSLLTFYYILNRMKFSFLFSQHHPLVWIFFIQIPLSIFITIVSKT